MRTIVSLAAAVVALAIAALTLVPAEVWSHPTVDQEYVGFDPHLVYAKALDNGSVAVSRSAVTLNSPSGATSAVTLISTPMQRIVVSINVTVQRNLPEAEPLRLGVWSPLKGVGYILAFRPAPLNLITADEITYGNPSVVMLGGLVSRSETLGTYATGKTYRIVLRLLRDQHLAAFQIFGDGKLLGQDQVTSNDFPELFSPLRLSLTAWSTGGTGSTQTVLENYQLTLVHERFWTSKVADPKAQLILLIVGLLAGLVAILGVIERRRSIVDGLGRASRLAAELGTSGRAQWAAIAGVVVAFSAYLIGNALLFRFGGHPFDMGGAKVFAYVASAYGPIQLYYLPNVVTLAPVWSGIPYMEAGYPYGPISTYVFAAIGWIDSIVQSGNSGGLALESLIKAVNVVFGLTDAILIYLILGRTGVSRKWQTAGSALFLFNPAVWYSMSVWGQTHVISIFFVLAAIYLLELGYPAASWLALIAACLTRPQMLVFALLIGIVLLRRFDWRRNLFGVAWAILLTFLLLLPLMAVSSPSLPVDLILNNFRIQEAGGNDPSVTTVSQGAYSIWPLVTLFEGDYGIQRIYAPSLNDFIGSLSYQRASQILTGAAMLILVVALLVKKRSSLERGGYLPIVAVGIASFLMLLTGIVSTHFLLALPFLILCRRWVDPVAYVSVVAVWTVTTLVPMFGDMGLILTTGNQLLAPAFKPITELAINTYTWDRFITAGVLANVLALIWISVLAFRPSAKPPSPTPA